MRQLAQFPEWSENNWRTQTMTKSKQSMMAAAIAGLVALGAIGSASALPKQSGSTPAPKGNVTTATAANFGGHGGRHNPYAPCVSNVCTDKPPAPEGKF
jgi:hypothetical protein